MKRSHGGGGMPRIIGTFAQTEQLGDFTTTSIESYWVGVALTWHFGRGS